MVVDIRFLICLGVLSLFCLVACSPNNGVTTADEGSAGPKSCEQRSFATRGMRLLTADEYQNTVQDLLGVDDAVTGLFPGVVRVEGFSNNSNVYRMDDERLTQFLKAAAFLAQRAVEENFDGLVNCDLEAGIGPCAQAFIDTFGIRAYRRPLSEEETARYLALYESVEDSTGFKQAVALSIETFLASPNFLYRSEMGSASDKDLYKLSPYELASALSYLLWQSMPDDTVFNAAANGFLSTREGIRSMAVYMLSQSRAEHAFVHFSREWLGVNQLDTRFKNPNQYPSFFEVKQDLSEEFDAFIKGVVFEQEGSIEHLLRADYSYLNARLEQYYGQNIPGLGERFEKVTVSEERHGVLTKGALLASYGEAEDASPIFRGLFVREKLLCQPIELPDSTTSETAPRGLDPALPRRERFASHNEDQECASCHRYIDPLGFGFDSYNTVGLYIQGHEGIAIDDSGEIVDIANEGTDEKTPFKGVGELSQILASSNEVAECFASQYITYSFGDVTEEPLSCVENRSALGLTNKTSIRSFIVDFVSSDFFRYRRVEGEADDGQ